MGRRGVTDAVVAEGATDGLPGKNEAGRDGLRPAIVVLGLRVRRKKGTAVPCPYAIRG